MAELGVPINVWQSRGVNSVTVKVSTTYRVPLRLSDAFYATSAVRGVSRSQVVLAEAVRRRADDAVVAVSCSFAVSGEVSEGGGRKGSFFSFFPPEEEEKTYTLLFSLSTSFPLSKRFLNKKNSSPRSSARLSITTSRWSGSRRRSGLPSRGARRGSRLGARSS